jgi:hypothetical protein
MGDLFKHERLNTEWKRMDDIEECCRVSGYKFNMTSSHSDLTTAGYHMRM